MNFPSIDIQGSILSTDLLGKIRAEQASFQQGSNFKSDYTNAKLKDEISFAWQEAKGQWTIFKSKLTRLKDGETGTTETRNFWISPLLTNLDYNLSFNRQAEELNGKSFPIGYRDSSLDNFPLYVGGYYESLDKRPANKQLRVSPHAMLQEYLNYSEHLYGIVTNGRQLRLLRDASRITRLSYVEFNLEKIMEEDLYADFVILYRLLHASRMPRKMDAGADSIIEKYHQEGLEAGSTIRNKLGDAVKTAIKNIANGFINHPRNTALRQAMAAGHIEADEYYRHQLRIIYRLLFLFVIEERNLVYADSKTAETKRFSQIYYNHYSLLRLRKLAKKLLPPEAERHYDLWQGLISTFSLFEQKAIGEKLGIMSLQGDLFSYEAIQNNHYDLHQCSLSNATLLGIIKMLGYFENDNKILIPVNYGGLDVEEFGSVYEGLLELQLTIKKVEGTDLYSCNFDSSNERGKSGSHYTPEELVQPLIKHSLEYLIADRLKNPKQFLTPTEIAKASPLGGGLEGAALLSLKICDVACGSGHILLSAARRLALELARVQTDEEQPNPLAIRKAMKAVIRHCIYGVDKNPLAIELCKIALWLEAYNPGEPLNFLDHHIKCGDAIVGLAHKDELQKGIATEAFKTLPGDDAAIAKSFRDRNAKEIKSKAVELNFEGTVATEMIEVLEKYNSFKNLPETNPDEVAQKAKAHFMYEQNYHRIRLQQLADAQVAQFFIPKTEANKDVLITDTEYRSFLRQINTDRLGPLQSNKLAMAQTVASKYNKNFFHWFLEFPEVINECGFDCILGNPPYLGGTLIGGMYGKKYLNVLKTIHQGGGDRADLIVYFLRRYQSIVNVSGFISMITTNTISQGDTKLEGLDYLISKNKKINFAIRSIKWIGKANLEVSLLSICSNARFTKNFLNGKSVSLINSKLDDSHEEILPFKILDKPFISQGSDPLGSGYFLEIDDAEKLIENNAKNRKVLFPILNGDDLNSSPSQSPSRFVINFFDWSQAKAEEFIDCFAIIETKVKPERQRWTKGNDGKEIEGQYALRNPLPQKYWIYKDKRTELYKTIEKNNLVLITAFTSKFISFTFKETEIIFSSAINVIDISKYASFTILQNSFHEYWAWKYSSTMESRLRYTINDVYNTFPFPQNLTPEQEQQLETIGEAYHEHRRQLMLGMQLGLTKTYNLFHSAGITAQAINETDKQVLGLQKHLAKTAGTISFNDAVQGILTLRALHVQMDEAVLAAYGWSEQITNDELKTTEAHSLLTIPHSPYNTIFMK